MAYQHQAQRHNNQRAQPTRQHTADTDGCALCLAAVDNPTLMRRHQRVAGEAWRVRATSGVGASEPALPRFLRCDLVLCCCVMSYSVLILSTTVAIPQRCRRSFHRHATHAARPPLLLLLLYGGCCTAAAVGVFCVCF